MSVAVEVTGDVIVSEERIVRSGEGRRLRCGRSTTGDEDRHEDGSRHES